MAFRPIATHARLFAWLAVALLLLTDLALLVLLLRTPLGPATVLRFLLFVLTLVLLILLAYRLWAWHRLDYWVDRDGVRIHWAGDRIDIPLPDIEMAEKGPAGPTYRYRWWAWPMGWIRPMQPEAIYVSYATCSPQACVALKTPYATVLISPQDSGGFLEALRERQALGPARALEPTIAEHAYRQHWLIQERLPLLLMGVGLLLGLIFLGMLIWRYPTIPNDIPLHFDAAGMPDRIGARRSILLIPAITLLIGFFNALIGIALFERQRLASYMLWSSALLLQVVGILIVNRLLLTIA